MLALGASPLICSGDEYWMVRPDVRPVTRV